MDNLDVHDAGAVAEADCRMRLVHKVARLEKKR